MAPSPVAASHSSAEGALTGSDRSDATEEEDEADDTDADQDEAGAEPAETVVGVGGPSIAAEKGLPLLVGQDQPWDDPDDDGHEIIRVP